MAQQLQKSKPQPTVYTLLIVAAVIAIGAALVMTYMDLTDAYGFVPEDFIKPLNEAVGGAK